MKKIASLSTLVAVLALSTAALADDVPDTRSTKDIPPPSTSTTAQPMGEAVTTTITSADVTATPMPSPTVRPPTRETMTVYEPYRPNRPLLYTGGALFLGSYAATAALTAANPNSDRTDKTLFLPVVGPWLSLADRDCKTCSSGENTLDTALIAGSGALQGIGVIMMTASLFVPEKIPTATIQAGNVKMNVTATTTGKGSAGIGAVGTF